MKGAHALRVVQPGALASLQGARAHGRAHLAYSCGGAFDDRAHAVANLAAGNAVDALALEVTMGGAVLEAQGALTCAWAGAPGAVVVDEGGAKREVAALAPFELREGGRVRIANRTSGMRVSLAVRGGLAGDAGALVAAGDTLAIAGGARAPHAMAADDLVRIDVASTGVAHVEGRYQVRCTDAAYTSAFSADALARFYGEEHAVVTGDRRGVRLRCAQPLAAPAGELASFGVTLGTVQVPPSGEPIILGPDQTTTGGYATIACVIGADAWRLAQLRPGSRIRFTRVTFEEAREAMLQWHRTLAALGGGA